MAPGFRDSPFVVFSNGIQELDSLADRQEAEQSLDHLGRCTLGDLYLNQRTLTRGLVCGAFVSPSCMKMPTGGWFFIDLTFKANENAIIVRRLMASHMSEPNAEVLMYVNPRLSQTI